MPGAKNYKEIDVNEYDAIQLHEYDHKFSLQALKIAGGENTTYYLRWACPQVGKDKYADKAIPIKVQLGDKGTAIETLKTLLAQIAGKQYPDDEISF